MVKDNKNIFIGIAFLIVLAIFVIPSLNIGKFAVGDTTAVVRNVPSTATPGSTFTITYTATSSDASWGVSIVDIIAGGCQFTNGKTEYKDVILSDGSTTRTMSVKAPSSGTCTFSGDYKFGSSAVVDFPNQVVTIGSICTDTCASLGYTSGVHTICGVSVDCGVPCTDTCASLGYNCGTHTICGASTNCGTCQTGYTCSSGTCMISGCTDTCESLGYTSGVHTICGASTNCGTGVFDLNTVVFKFNMGQKVYEVTYLHLIFTFLGLFVIKMFMSK
jgi:hypothetical protein